MTKSFRNPLFSCKPFKILSMSLSHPCHFPLPLQIHCCCGLSHPVHAACVTPCYQCHLARAGWHNLTAWRHQLWPLTENTILIQCNARAKCWGGGWKFCFLITAAINAVYNSAAKNQTRPQTSQFPTALGANVAQ